MILFENAVLKRNKSVNVCILYVLHIRDSGRLLSTRFVKVDKASSPATSSKIGDST